MFDFIRPFIFNLDPEKAHDLAIKSLKINFLPESLFSVQDEEMLSLNLLGKDIKNPIGLAAGFDKNAEVYNQIFKLGFGFVEVGTVTPKKQSGNAKPRMFRLEEDRALINRLGFNNDGSEIIKKRIENNIPYGLFGINIGPNKDSSNMTKDFFRCAETFFSLGDYITINISSPNTIGLREFQKGDSLRNLLSGINEIREKSFYRKFFLLKISPDLNDSNITEIIDMVLEFKIDGLILTNTTDKNREDLLDKRKNEKGGLSGKPITDLSTKLIRNFYPSLKGRAIIIGVGGVDSGKSAFDKIDAGASAIQLYTGMIYKGPTVVKKIKKELINILKEKNINNIKDAIGSASN